MRVQKITASGAWLHAGCSTGNGGRGMRGSLLGPWHLTLLSLPVLPAPLTVRHPAVHRGHQCDVPQGLPAQLTQGGAQGALGRLAMALSLPACSWAEGRSFFKRRTLHGTWIDLQCMPSLFVLDHQQIFSAVRGGSMAAHLVLLLTQVRRHEGCVAFAHLGMQAFACVSLSHAWHLAPALHPPAAQHLFHVSCVRAGDWLLRHLLGSAHPEERAPQVQVRLAALQEGRRCREYGIGDGGSLAS